MKSPTCNHKHEIINQNWDAVGISGTYREAVGRSGKIHFPSIVSLHA